MADASRRCNSANNYNIIQNSQGNARNPVDRVVKESIWALRSHGQGHRKKNLARQSSHLGVVGPQNSGSPDEDRSPSDDFIISQMQDD
jgi:hypothetical protein